MLFTYNSNPGKSIELGQKSPRDQQQVLQESITVLFLVVHIHALWLQILERFGTFLSQSCSIWVSVCYPWIVSKELFNTEPVLKGMLSSCGTSRTIGLFRCANFVIRIYLVCSEFLGWQVWLWLLGCHSPQKGGGKAEKLLLGSLVPLGSLGSLPPMQREV